MPSSGFRALLAALMLMLAGPATAEPAEEDLTTTLCRLIETAAARHGLPASFMTRLIWRESSFRPHVVSYAGAQGIAQFMPGTAAERGLLDPFDPDEAIPASAALLADLRDRFGNLGLAAAAYNAGPRRVERWLAEATYLPLETEDYVLFVTRRPAEHWRERPLTPEAATDHAAGPSPKRCAETLVAIRAEVPRGALAEGPIAPWGVQIAGNFSKARALASYRRISERNPKLFAGLQPMVIGTRMRSRGTRAFYRVRAPAATRAEASAFCGKLRRVGGACVVFRSR